MIVPVCDTEIYVEQHGQGQDILLLHGWGCSTELWKPVTDRLMQSARVTVIDFPGHGKSGRPPVPWGVEEHVAMLDALLRELKIERCDIIGHSHGGRIALAFAAVHPEHVNKMVLTGAAGLRGEPTEAQKKRSAQFKRLKGISEALDRVKILGPLPGKMREALRQKYGSADYNALDEEMRKTFVKLVNVDLRDVLPNIKASTLLIWGSGDTETPLWMGQMMEKLIPDAGLVVLSGGSHYAHLEKLPEFLRITEHFLLGGP